MSSSLTYYKVTAGDTVNAETWVRYENKVSYSRNMNIAALAGLLAGNFNFTQPFETYTLSQTTTAFSNALTSAGFMGDGADTETPFAYINYILFDESMNQVDAGWRRVSEDAGFDPGQEALTFHQHKRLALTEPVHVPENGYIYIWVSNESEGTKVWFDDVKVTHTQVVVTQASDYGVWGDVLREQKAPEFTYRHGYQGNFSEKDEETGWNHFELREYDAVIGRWMIPDPMRQHSSPYLSMGNNGVNKIDVTGGLDEYELINGVITLMRVDCDQDMDYLTVNGERQAFAKGLLSPNIDINNDGMETSNILGGINLAKFISFNIATEIAGVQYKSEKNEYLLVINPYYNSTAEYVGDKVVRMGSVWQINPKHSSGDFTGVPIMAFHIHSGHPDQIASLGRANPSEDDKIIAVQAWLTGQYESLNKWVIIAKYPMNNGATISETTVNMRSNGGTQTTYYNE